MVICLMAKKVTCSECEYRVQCNKNVVTLPRRRKKENVLTNFQFMSYAA